jgi:hypothetical protein
VALRAVVRNIALTPNERCENEGGESGGTSDTKYWDLIQVREKSAGTLNTPVEIDV